MECCIYGEIFVAELSKRKKLLHCKFSKLDQISCVDKTGHGFVRLGHISFCYVALSERMLHSKCSYSKSNPTYLFNSSILRKVITAVFSVYSKII